MIYSECLAILRIELTNLRFKKDWTKIEQYYSFFIFEKIICSAIIHNLEEKSATRTKQ